MNDEQAGHALVPPRSGELELCGWRAVSGGMVKSPSINNPAHWRRRAEESRRVAEQLDDPVAKRTMLEIAQSYEQLALHAEQKPLRKPSP